MLSTNDALMLMAAGRIARTPSAADRNLSEARRIGAHPKFITRLAKIAADRGATLLTKESP